MRTIKVDKGKLIKNLKTSRQWHFQEYKEAEISYRNKVLEEISALKTKIESGGRIDFTSILNLVKPQSNIKDYDSALKQLEWEKEDFVELTDAEFRQYIEDDWDWSNRFKAQTSLYKSPP